MCFSATASFVAGSALAATGVITTSRAATRRGKGAKEIAFASIPLFFGIQQILDGIVWVAASGGYLHTFASYGFAFFAYVFWPAFIPFAVLRLEPRTPHRRPLRVLVIVGVLTALYAWYLLITGPVTAHVVNSCIRYDTYAPYALLMLIPYIVATCGSCLLSSHRLVNVFGMVSFFAVAIAAWFFIETFTSVWCFFAAVLSALIYWRYRA